MTTHYECLGVDPSAPLEEIRTAYLRLARDRHPDAHPEAAESELAESNRSMAALNAAWFVLRDDDRRRLYDHSLSASDPPPAPLHPDEPAVYQDGPAFEQTYEPFVGRDVAAGIARLWAFVLTVMILILAALFTYAFVKSGSVGAF